MRPPSAGVELGFHGSTIWDGLVQEDYNPDLRHPHSIAIYDKMRRSSTQVQSIETVISLPIRTVRKYVEPAGTGASDREAADLVERNLLNGDWMSSTFDDLIRKSLISTISRSWPSVSNCKPSWTRWRGTGQMR